MEQNIIPTIVQIEEYLREYGWNYRKTNNPQNQEEIIIAPCSLNESQGILVSFAINGEFVLVSTVGLLDDVPKNNACDFLILNDTIKLVKIFATPHSTNELINIDLSFELWAESWNKTTFFCFMDMLSFSIKKVIDTANEKQISHSTKYIEFVKNNNQPQSPDIQK